MMTNSSMPPVTSKAVTSFDYENSIPPNCRLTTLEDHASIMYCWSLLASIKEGNKFNCGLCEFNNEYTPEEYNRLFAEQQQKHKVWKILNAKV